MTDEPQPAGEQQPISVDELADLYPGQCILLKVTARDEHEVATHGIVITAGPTRESIQERLMEELLAAKARNDGSSYLVYGGYKPGRAHVQWVKLLIHLVMRESSLGKQRK